MANSLTFTGTMFVSASQLISSSQLDAQHIVKAGQDGSRVYGISAKTNASSSVQVTISYSSSTAVVLLYNGIILANAGNTSSVAAADLFGSTVGASVFQKQKDANGVPYFNMPPNSSLTSFVSGSPAQRLYGTGTVDIITFGENY